MILLDFTIAGVPISAQTKSPKARRNWRNRIRATARAESASESSIVADEVSIVILYFYEGDTDIDVDNVPKLILDALSSIVYLDDMQVSQVITRKTRLAGGLVIDSPSPSLAAALDVGGDFVYVRVDGPPDHGSIP